MNQILNAWLSSEGVMMEVMVIDQHSSQEGSGTTHCLYVDPHRCGLIIDLIDQHWSEEEELLTVKYMDPHRGGLTVDLIKY